MKTIVPIVGMAFRPPASKVLAELPFGTALLLQRQPDNEYDPNAIKVLLPGFSAEGEHKDLFVKFFNQALPDEHPAGRGLFNQGVLTDPLFLGYVAAKTEQAGLLAPFMDEVQVEGDKQDTGPVSLEGELSANAAGNPAILLDLPDELASQLNQL